jgi:hypothetical protein
MCVGHVPWLAGWTGTHGWLRLFIFAWPIALVFLLICFPAWRGGRAFVGSAFALSFWSEGSMLHRGGF